MSKLTLSKSSPISLTKDDGGSPIKVNLSWSAGRRGLFKSKPIDLDLAALYELKNGRKGVVQALGNQFDPQRGLITLDGDDRSGGGVGGENMVIDLSRKDEIKRVLIFAYIYEGTPAWNKADGVLTFYPQSGQAIEVKLDSTDTQARSCAIALLENIGGQIVVKHEVRYINGTHEAVDAAYGWGMRWTPGKK